MFRNQLKKLSKLNQFIPKNKISPITINELLQFYSRKVIGEEELLLQQTFAFLGNQSFGIVGRSGSGKTKILESLLSIVPNYQLDLSSELIPFYDSKLKKSDWVYISELQRTGKTMKEVIKNVVEGKPIKRTVTRGREKEELIIPAKNVCFTLATENQYKIGSELRRRFLILNTDESEEQTRKILSENTNKINFPSPQRYLNSCLNLPVYNPHIDFLLKNLPLTLEMRSFFPQLRKVVEGFTRFNYTERELDNKRYISTIEDNKFIKKLFEFSFIS